MKNLLIILLVSIGTNINAQDSTDISNLPATVPYTWHFPGNSKRATTHGAFAYDTIPFIVINKYGLDQDTITGEYLNDVYDTLYFQRKYDFSWTPEGMRSNVTYKFLNK